MTFFKYCNSQHLSLVLGGSLRFSSLAYFRHIERDNGDQNTGDALEGKSEIVLDQLEVNDSPTEIEQAVLSRSPVHIEKGVKGNITISNVRSVQDVGHWLIFCFTTAQFYQGYDARVQIEKPDLLRNLIWNSGVIDGIPVHQLFDLCFWRPVTYGRRTVSAFELNETPIASPFLKRLRYRHQEEFRIALRAKDQSFRDIVDVRITVPEGLLVAAPSSHNTPQILPTILSRSEIADAMVKFVADFEDMHEVAISLCPGPDLPENASEEEVVSIAEASHKLKEKIRITLENEFRQHHNWRDLTALYWSARANCGVRAQSDWSLEAGAEKAHILVPIFAEMADKLCPGCLPRKLWLHLPSRRRDELSGRS